MFTDEQKQELYSGFIQELQAEGYEITKSKSMTSRNILQPAREHWKKRRESYRSYALLGTWDYILKIVPRAFNGTKLDDICPEDYEYANALAIKIIDSIFDTYATMLKRHDCGRNEYE